MRRMSPRWRRALAVLAVGAGLAAAVGIGRAAPRDESSQPAAGEPSPSAAAGTSRASELYGRLHIGMSYDDVAKLLGGPGEEIAWRRLYGETLETKVWTDGTGATIYVTFRDGVAILKSQLGVPALDDLGSPAAPAR